MKVTIVGAGAVGASCLEHIAELQLANDIVLIDVKPGLAEGKVLDLEQSYAILPRGKTKIYGVTNDYATSKNSSLTIITSGIPRKPGMSREELISTNATIVRSVAEQCLAVSPNTIFIIVSNPMDTLTYLAVKTLGIDKQRIIGMGGVLDSARFKYYISKSLNTAYNTVEAMVIGGHGDATMIPLYKRATANGRLISEILSPNEIHKIVKDTMVGGATVTQLMGTSACIAPGAAVSDVAAQVISDSKKILPCSVYLDGQYGYSDLCIGVPVSLGKKGWEKIEELALDTQEKEAFDDSVRKVQELNSKLNL